MASVISASLNFDHFYLSYNPTCHDSFHYKLNQMLDNHINSPMLKGHVTLSKTNKTAKALLTDSGNYSNTDAYKKEKNVTRMPKYIDKVKQVIPYSE